MPANLPLIYGIPSLLDRLMDQTDTLPLPAPQEASVRHFPPLQIFEDEDALYVRALVPGISLEHLDVAAGSRKLTLKGVVPLLPGRHMRRDRPAGPFQRHIRLPFPIDNASVKAVMRNGILTVTLPRDQAAKKRSISVRGVVENNP